jgi:hypothetical protein
MISLLIPAHTFPKNEITAYPSILILIPPLPLSSLPETLR